MLIKQVILGNDRTSDGRIMATSLEALAWEGTLFLLFVTLASLVSVGEFALFGLPTFRRRQLLEEGHPRIDSVEMLLKNPRRLLVTIVVTKTFLRVSAATTAAVIALSAPLPFKGWSLALAVVLSTLVLLTVSDLAPRAYAARHAERLALSSAPAFRGLQILLRPVWALLERYADLLFRILGARPGEAAAQFRSEEELRTLITLGAEEGILEEEEEEMIQSVIELGETTTKEVMVPRIDMTAVPSDATLDVIRPYALESGFSRIPVYESNVDNVVGVLYVKDMLLHLIEKTTPPSSGSLSKKVTPTLVKDLMREPFFVPESMRLADVLEEMRETRVHMAIVVDEFGGTAGLLTLEDILEEIVGDIFDEYDLRHDPVRRLDANTAIVDARTHVADVNDALDIRIPEDEGYDTVAGYVQHELGRMGREGETVHGKGFDITVEKVTNRRILRARVLVHTARDEPGKARG